MSVGAPSNLGTLLIQRLDAVLGTVLSQQASLVTGAGQQAVVQPGDPENLGAPDSATRKADESGGQRTAPERAARDVQVDNLLRRGTTYQASTRSAPTTLGFAARIILALLNNDPRGQQALPGRTPLLPQTPAAAGRAVLGPTAAMPSGLVTNLAETLTQTVQGSGLFYESHLAQLAAGKRSLRALRSEPQGQIPPRTPADAPTPGRAPAGGTPTAAGSQASASAQVQQAQTQAAMPGTPAHGTASASDGSAASTPSSHGAPAAADGAPPPPVPGIDPQAQWLVRQQLEVLANQCFAWQGQAWPGADLQFEIRRRTPGDEGARDFEATHWATQLTLNLPRLGPVHARLSLAGEQLVMHLTAPESAPQLSEAIEPLRERLQAHGLQASQLSVSNEPLEGRSASDAHPTEPNHAEITS